MRSSFRVLSLDGGGARGFLSAKILANIENTLSEQNSQPRDGDQQRDSESQVATPLGQYFDLIVGTSTGAILAAGLAADLSANKLLSIYEDGLPRIFKKRSGVNPFNWVGPTYSNHVLKQMLLDALGNLSLNEVSTDVCLVSVSLNSGQPRLHKSDYLARNKGRGDEHLVDVVLASAAAPTFFPPAVDLKHSSLLVDGGVCANNPAMIGLIEAAQFERPSKSRQTPVPAEFPRDITLLSIGTGKRSDLPFDPDKLKNAGKFRWVKPGILRAWITGENMAVPVIELLMESQTRLVEKQVEFLMPDDQYLRINPILDRNYPLDDVSHLGELSNYADLNAEAHEWVIKHLSGSGGGRG